MIRPRVVVCSPVMLACALILLTATAARAQSGYGFVPLDPQGFTTGSITLDINESGTVLMRRVDGTYIWTQAGGVAPLIADPDVNARFRARSFNNANKVLGVACQPGCPAPPALPATWSQSEGLVFLPLTTAAAINNGGTIVGTSSVSPAILRPGQAPQPIPGAASAVAVNDAEQVAGLLPSGFAYIWTQAGGMITIPKLAGRTDSDWVYRVSALNNAGQVVGTFQHIFDLSEPDDSEDGGVFLWSPSTGTIDLRFPDEEGGPQFLVVTANDRGHVAVTWYNDFVYPFSMVYRGGRWLSVFADNAPMQQFRIEGINNAGWVTGSGEYYNPPFPISSECVVSTFQCAGWVVTAPSVNLTVNGVDGPLTLGPGSPLNLAFAFDAPGGTVTPTEVYAGFITTSGITWFHPTTGVSATPAPLYQGPLPPFGPAPLLSIPDAAVVPPGQWLWFVVIDYGLNGVVNGDFIDVALTTVTGGPGG